MKRFGLMLLAGVGLSSCGSPGPLTVRQFHLRDTEVTKGNEYVRAEMNHRLHTAVTQEERENRLGQYYTIRWRGLTGNEPIEIRMNYRQAGSAAQVKSLTQRFAPSRSGQTEITMTGEDYRRRGRITAWEMILKEGGQEITRKQSYLWK